MIGCSTATMSAVSVTSVAPCLIRPLVPSARGSSGDPGTAKTSRPCSSAKPRGDQRARAFGGLDDDDAERQAGNQPVAAREIAPARLPAERHFGDGGAGRQDGVEQVGMFRRIDAVLAAGEHRHGTAFEAGAVGGRVDAARQPGDDGEAGLAEIAREPLGELDAGGRGVARADDGHHAAAPARSPSPRTAMSGGASSIICSRGG